MKIAYFTDTFVPNINGIVTSILNSSENLAKKGNKIYIFTIKPKEKNFQIPKLHKNIQVFHYPRLNLIKYPDFQLAYPKLLDINKKFKEINPDIIHIHTPSIFGWAALILNNKYKKPVVGTYHTLLPDFLDYLPLPIFNKSKTAKRLTWGYTRKFYNKCNIVTTPSIAMKQELEKHGIKNVKFLSNGVDLKKFHPIQSKKDGKTILHVGRIGYEKNIDVLIKAFNELLKKNKNVKLLIAGKGPDLEGLKEFTQKLGISKNVEFLGPIKHDNLPKLYSKADIFVTPSTVETEGLVILEAMACGLPIIGVNKLAVPYIVKNNKNGFITKPGDYKEIANCMEKLLKDKKSREKFGKESLILVKEFSLESIIKKIEEIYKELIKKKK
ncbi:MAG: glycosyltransferase [Candidatus Nanoarchaeia archaeon]